VGNVGIPTRAVAALERAGVKTLRQLLQLSDQDVLRIPGIGRATLAKLIRALRDIGVLAEDH
jgi:DNA-directed RNA polymerase alpha subunit